MRSSVHCWTGPRRPAFSRSDTEDFSPLEVWIEIEVSEWLEVGQGDSSAMRFNNCNIEKIAMAAVGFMYIVISKPRHNYHASEDGAR